MAWVVEIGDEFDPEFDELPEEVQDELLAYARLLETTGPQLGRPWADTLAACSASRVGEKWGLSTDSRRS